MKTTYQNNIAFSGNVGASENIFRNEKNTVCSFQMAQYLGKDQNKKDIVIWHKVKAFAAGKNPVDLNIIAKGARLVVEGRLAVETFENKDGMQMQKTVVIADRLEALPAAKKAEAEAEAKPEAKTKKTSKKALAVAA